jgi:hypothetical protein
VGLHYAYEWIVEEVQAVEGGGDGCEVGSDCGAGTLGQHLLVEVDQHRANACGIEPSAAVTSSTAKVGEPAAAETQKPLCDVGVNVLDDQVPLIDVPECCHPGPSGWT